MISLLPELPSSCWCFPSWARFHSELKTLLQEQKIISWIWCFVAVCCNDSEELVPWSIREVREYRGGCGLPSVCLVTLPSLHPPSVHFCQGLLKGLCKSRRNLGVILIADLSGKKSWKQLGSTHVEFDVPLSTPGVSASQRAPDRAGQSCWGGHSMPRELELSGCGCTRHTQHSQSPPGQNIPSSLRNPRQFSPQSFLASGIFTYTDFLSTITHCFKHRAFLASPWTNFSSKTDSEEKKNLQQAPSLELEQAPEHRQHFAMCEEGGRQQGLVTRARGQPGSIKHTRHTSCRKSPCL